MNILVKGQFTSPSGYSQCTRTLVELLHNRVQVRVERRERDSIQLQEELSDFWKKNLTLLSDTTDFKPDAVLWFETPEFYRPSLGAINIAYTMFETSGIPRVDISNDPIYNWVHQLNKMDLVLTPSTFCKDTFIKCGVTTPIKVVPLVAHDPLTNEKDPLVPRKHNGVRFLSVFQWTPRKNPETLLLAFWNADLGPNAELLLKTYRSNFSSSEIEGITSTIEQLKKSFHKEPENQVHLITELLSDEDMDRLYFSTDLYITTTRGEGQNLPMIEAMLARKPSIASDGASHKDFFDKEVGFPVDYSWAPVRGIPWIPWYSPDQEWMEVDYHHLMKQMTAASQYIQNGGRTNNYLGEAARERALQRFSPEAVWRVLEPILLELEEGVYSPKP